MKRYALLRFIVVIRAILLFFNVIFALALLLSYFASTISPESFWPVSFFGLAYPFLLLINLMFIAMWAVQRHWLLFLSLLAILVGWNHLTSLLPINFSKKESTEEGFRILSYNVQNFDLYNWSGNKDSRDSMVALIAQSKPDIACFQEFYASDDGYFRNIPVLKKSLDLPHYYFKKTFTNKDKNHWGIAIFSKFPIENTGFIDFGNSINNGCIFADIRIDGRLMRIFNVHLQSIHFGSEDYALIDKVVEEQDADMNASKLLLAKIKRAFVKRASQSEKIAEAIAESPYPVILCGDFNDTPNSYAYRILSGDLYDAFLQKGSGIGHTYAGKLPALRIDYILMSKEFEVLSYNRVKKKISDHFPIHSNFKWQE